jgi:predicted phosphodiesterase
MNFNYELVQLAKGKIRGQGKTWIPGKKNSIGAPWVRDKVEVTRYCADKILAALRDPSKMPTKPRRKNPLSEVEQKVKDFLTRRKDKAVDVNEISTVIDRSDHTVAEAIKALGNHGFNAKFVRGRKATLASEPAVGAHKPIVHELTDYHGRRRKIGICSDWHLCNKNQRLDVLNTLYDIYEDNGITEVYVAGNWIDGECRFNKTEIFVGGMDNQLDYWIEKTPQKKGITTYFVAGDDHEGWYQQREGVEIGRYGELRAQAQGRKDMVYVGYVEADIELKAEKGSRVMRVMHPGGGTAYAISYKAQKNVEALQGGEKPAILIQGHYHKMNVCYPRNVWVLDAGTCCDQTIWMRKKGLEAHVGGAIIEFTQAPSGEIIEFVPRYFPFFDKGFYIDRQQYKLQRLPEVR